MSALDPAIFARRAQQLGPAAEYINRPDIVRLGWGLPDPRLFPANDYVAATQRVLNREAARVLQYGAMPGDPILVEALAAKLSREEGQPITSEHLLLVNGASQGLELACRLFANPGDVVLMEVPTFAGNFATIAAHDAELRGVPVDAEGVDLATLEAELTAQRRAGRRVAFLYVIPNFHNPTGQTMTPDRRRALLELAARWRLPLVEDDVYGDLRYDGVRQPALWWQDRAGYSIQINSFSKTLGPGLRVGWICGAPDVIKRLARLKRDSATSPLTAAMLGEFFRMGRYPPLLARAIQTYRAKRDVALGALAEFCPASVGWTRPEGGFFIWLRLPKHITSDALVPAAREAGVSVLGGTACFPDGAGGQHNIRIAFSQPDPAEITEGIARLGHTLKQLGA
jgi:2-aminoadipate transaminase